MLAGRSIPIDPDPAAEPLTAELGPGEEHRYRFDLDEGDFVRLRVDQQGVDVVAILTGPEGTVPVAADRPSEGNGPELVAAVAARSGPYELSVRQSTAQDRGRYRVVFEARRRATLADRRLADAYRRFVQTREISAAEEPGRWRQAAATWRELGEPALEGEAIRRLAFAHNDRRDYEAAAPLFRAAAAAFERAGERWWEAGTRFSLGSCLLNLGDLDGAQLEYGRALELAREESDRYVEGLALQGLGMIHLRRSELQLALDRLEPALEHLEGDRRGFRAGVLHELGVLHARYLGEVERGRALLTAALEAWPETWGLSRARTLEQLGRLAYESGSLDEARRFFEASLAVPRDGDPCGRAITAARLAVVEEARGARAEADSRLAEALAGIGEVECGQREVIVHLQAAELAERRGDHRVATDRYRRSEALYRDQGDRNGRAWSLAGIARAERALDNPEAALAAGEEALAIYEGVRPTVLREDLRTSFFAGAQGVFDLQVELLVEAGRDADGWVVAERARAQALRDLLAEAGAGLRHRADPELIEREHALQEQLDDIEIGLGLGGNAGAAADLEAALVALEEVRSEIRRGGGPGPEAGPPTLGELRAVVDPGTLFIEFRLARRRSHLWAVTEDSIEAIELPPRADLEALAGEAAGWLESLEWPGRNPAALCELSRLLLGPVADRLADPAGRRLVLVPDGALQSLAFAALPEPSAAAADCAGAPPLVAAHEISYLPSAATLATQRRRLAERPPASGWLAVVADPVYEAGDERLAGAAAGRSDVRRSVASATSFRRLPHSGDEAADVLALLPSERTLAATGFDATREAVLRGALGDHRIVHFATHGELDPDLPLRSFLALSRLDRRGRPVAGDLYAHEIYGLDVPAELVVLSACDTALGREVRGEGLVSGLPRAFLYAGAARVLVSLWSIQDRSTRELMASFYRGLLERGLRPAEALRQAQLELRRSDPRPHRWAGFVLHGDPRPLPPFGG